MWLLRPRLFRPFGPVGLAFMAYRYWRGLPRERKAELKQRARRLTRVIAAKRLSRNQ
jgi:hypothetical protein